ESRAKPSSTTRWTATSRPSRGTRYGSRAWRIPARRSRRRCGRTTTRSSSGQRPKSAAHPRSPTQQSRSDKEAEMGRKTFVVGVGMTKFEKPQSKEWDYPDMARESIGNALADAGVDYKEVQQACVGYVYGESTCG